MKIPAFLLALLLLFLNTGTARPLAQEPDPCKRAMALLDDTVLGFKSYTGTFSHKVYFVNEGAVEVEEGALTASKGGRLRWDYSTPPGKVFVCDGRTAWLYLPDDNRAYKIKVAFKKKLPILARIFLGELKPSKEFFCVASKKEGDITRIELGFKEKNVSFRRLEVAVDEKTRFFSEISYIDEFDNRVTFLFTGGKSGGAPLPGLFEFKPPDGAKISEEAEELGEQLGM